MKITGAHRRRLVRRERTLRTAAAFGLCADRPVQRHSERLVRIHAAADLLDHSLGPSRVALVTGPSGSGKSTLLKIFRARCPRVVLVDPAEVDRFSLPLAELTRLSLKEWLGTLARFGLAEADVLLQTPAQLSAGQRYRLALALAASRCALFRAGHIPTITLIADEFGSLLDRPTAQTIAVSLRKWAARQPHVRVVAATAHEDLRLPMWPEVVVEMSEHEAVVKARRPIEQDP